MSTPPGAAALSDVLERRTVILSAVVALVMMLGTPSPFDFE
ncbi:MAG: hypothetical protein ACRDNE_13145 [Gaiellaceae bacterium]